MRKATAWVCALGALALVFAVGARGAPQEKRPEQKASGARPEAAERKDTGAAAPASEAVTKLPVERVVLYKSGVGYFEHEGQVRGDQSVSIDFTSGQLNDVLSSLTVLDLNGGRIAGISYNSEAPLSQRLGALKLPLAENTNLAQFYGALRGARLEVRSGNSTINGRLLSIEQKQKVTGTTTEQVALATLVSDSGEVRSVEITPGLSVRLADRDVTSEVQSYLSLVASERQADLRRMTIQTEGTGARELYVSYISEVPIWKTTYRIVLPSKPGDEPLLQGWAIVDNTVGEDWNNVQLSLVAGAPQSFIQQLSQPYYSRRPVIPLPQTAELTPQTHESAMEGGNGTLKGTVNDPSGAAVVGAQVKLIGPDGQVADTDTTDDQGQYELDDEPAGTYQVQVSLPGFNTATIRGISLGGGQERRQDVRLQVGSVTETVTVEARASSMPMANRNPESFAKLSTGAVAGAAAPMAIDQARRQMEAAAKGVELGDLFEYKLKDRVTIHKNESALVPIVQAHVKAEKVSLWNVALGSERPLRALWLTNTSGLTLDGGNFSVLEDETFAGEGLTDPVKPGEKRLISYASDLGVRVDAKSQSTSEPVTEVRIAHGVLWQTREERRETIYKVRDDDTTPRTVAIEHPLRLGWALTSDSPKPAEKTSSAYRFELQVEPKTTGTLDVHEVQPTSSSYALNNMTSDLIALFVRQKSITPEIQAALEKIIAQKNNVSGLQDELNKRENERQRIFSDQGRLRENLKALRGTPEERALTQRYVQQLNDEETQLDNLKKETADYTARRDKAQQELDRMIGNLSMDATI
jgi:Carboxypeptidase regulatory-like domain